MQNVDTLDNFYWLMRNTKEYSYREINECVTEDRSQ